MGEMKKRGSGSRAREHVSFGREGLGYFGVVSGKTFRFGADAITGEPVSNSRAFDEVGAG